MGDASSVPAIRSLTRPITQPPDPLTDRQLLALCLAFPASPLGVGDTEGAHGVVTCGGTTASRGLFLLRRHDFVY